MESITVNQMLLKKKKITEKKIQCSKDTSQAAYLDLTEV